MRRSLCVLLALSLLAPELPARDVHDWKNIEKLTNGTPVLVLLWNKNEIAGQVDSVSDTYLRIATPDHTSPQFGWIHTIDRASVREIRRGRELPDLPNPHHWMAVGALIGGAAGVTSGATADVQRGNQDRWLIGGLAGAGFGALVGNVAAALFGIGKAVPALNRRGKVIYEDASSNPSANGL